jgi:hypothetical protein
VWNHLSELIHIQKQFDLYEVKHVVVIINGLQKYLSS